MPNITIEIDISKSGRSRSSSIWQSLARSRLFAGLADDWKDHIITDKSCDNGPLARDYRERSPRVGRMFEQAVPKIMMNLRKQVNDGPRYLASLRYR